MVRKNKKTDYILFLKTIPCIKNARTQNKPPYFELKHSFKEGNDEMNYLILAESVYEIPRKNRAAALFLSNQRFQSNIHHVFKGILTFFRSCFFSRHHMIANGHNT